jgi:hypothetical protein
MRSIIHPWQPAEWATVHRESCNIGGPEEKMPSNDME